MRIGGRPSCSRLDLEEGVEVIPVMGRLHAGFVGVHLFVGNGLEGEGEAVNPLPVGGIPVHRDVGRGRTDCVRRSPTRSLRPGRRRAPSRGSRKP